MAANKQMGKTGLFLISSLFFLVGTGGLVLICWGVYLDLSTYGWDEVDCTIESSAIERIDSYSEAPYWFKVSYRYQVGGESYTSKTVARLYSGHYEYAEADRLLEKYPGDGHTTCFVNPSDPTDALLEHSIQWYLFPVALLPLFFLLGGLFGYYRWWSSVRKRRSRLERWLADRMGRKSREIAGRCAVLGFFSLFLIPGLIYLTWGVLLPSFKILSARSWDKTECSVISCNFVARSSDGDAPTTEYSPDILYSYRYGGAEYRSNRFDFLEATTGDFSFIEEIKKRYVPGSTTRCYVNPGNPREATLNVDFDAAVVTALLLPALISLVFIAIGAWGYWKIFWRSGRSRPPPSARG